MAQRQFERFYMRIVFKYIAKDDNTGREISYIYNREALDALNINKQQWDNSQVIKIGDILTFEDYECKVVNVIFRLYDGMEEMGKELGIASPLTPCDYNCQITVYVDRI